MARAYRIDIAGRIPCGAVEDLTGISVGMAVETTSDRTTLRGTLSDSAAVYGLIARLEALGLALLAITSDPAAEIADTSGGPRSGLPSGSDVRSAGTPSE